MPLDIFFLTDITPRYPDGDGRAEAQLQAIIALGPMLHPMLVEHDLNKPLRAQHFLAQVCHETAGLAVLEEASGDAYEGRQDLGNVEAGDGPRFKGRGVFQLVGRTNYAGCAKALGLDLLGNPAMAAEPVVALRIACAYWNRSNLSSYADVDDLVAVSKVLNTGRNGLTMPNGLRNRQAYLSTIKGIWELHQIRL